MKNVRIICFLLASTVISCGKDVSSGRSGDGETTILDDDSNVMDATAFGVASKAELDATVINSMALADASLGRMFDFDDGTSFLSESTLSASIKPVTAGKAVFCDGEVVSADRAWMDGANLRLSYEADVTACVAKPMVADQLVVDRQLAAFSLTFACGSRDLSGLAGTGKASVVMGTAGAFSCPADHSRQSATGRAYRFAGLVEGRFIGPRSEVPVQQRFWRGYDSGTTGEPCLLTRYAGSSGPAGDRLGACRMFERSESINKVDNSRKGRLLTASASARTRNGSLFDDGELAVKFNGWSASRVFSSQDSDISIDFLRPNGECARFVLRPSAVSYEARDCR